MGDVCVVGPICMFACLDYADVDGDIDGEGQGEGEGDGEGQQQQQQQDEEGEMGAGEELDQGDTHAHLVCVMAVMCASMCQVRVGRGRPREGGSRTARCHGTEPLADTGGWWMDGWRMDRRPWRSVCNAHSQLSCLI